MGFHEDGSPVNEPGVSGSLNRPDKSLDMGCMKKDPAKTYWVHSLYVSQQWGIKIFISLCFCNSSTCDQYSVMETSR